MWYLSSVILNGVNHHSIGQWGNRSHTPDAFEIGGVATRATVVLFFRIDTLVDFSFLSVDLDFLVV